MSNIIMQIPRILIIILMISFVVYLGIYATTSKVNDSKIVFLYTQQKIINILETHDYKTLDSLELFFNEEFERRMAIEVKIEDKYLYLNKDNYFLWIGASGVESRILLYHTITRLIADDDSYKKVRIRMVLANV